MTQLSKNFTLAEFTRSETARRRGLDNKPSYEHIENMQHLAQNLLQPIRDYFNKPIIITSGYRGVALNKAIGGASNSQHMKGEAVDFYVSGVHSKRVWEYIQRVLEHDQLIAEYLNRNEVQTGWIHCSLKEKNNRQEAASITRARGYELGFHYDS